MDSIYVVFAKLGTVLIDRRFWAYLLSLALIIGVIPATVDSEALADELVAAIQMIIAGASALIGMGVLVHSWTKRPPSGQDYKEVPEELPEEVVEVAEALLAEIRSSRLG